MSITLYDLECCAGKEVAGLMNTKTPEQAMKEVCHGLKKFGGNLGTPPGFILFSAIVKVDEKADDLNNEYLSNHGLKNLGYGEAFAAYIKEHKLGTVTKCPARPNRINHPNHIVRMWMWCPDPKRLTAWWIENRVRKTE